MIFFQWPKNDSTQQRLSSVVTFFCFVFSKETRDTLRFLTCCDDLKGTNLPHLIIIDCRKNQLIIKWREEENVAGGENNYAMDLSVTHSCSIHSWHHLKLKNVAAFIRLISPVFRWEQKKRHGILSARIGKRKARGKALSSRCHFFFFLFFSLFYCHICLKQQFLYLLHNFHIASVWLSVWRHCRFLFSFSPLPFCLITQIFTWLFLAGKKYIPCKIAMNTSYIKLRNYSG